MAVCDGLKGLPDSVDTVWDKTIAQTCVAHLLRDSFRSHMRDNPSARQILTVTYERGRDLTAARYARACA